MGRLGNPDRVLGTGRFNIMMGNAAGRLHEEDDEMGELKVKGRKSRKWGGLLHYRKTDAPKSLAGISPVWRCSCRRRDGEDRNIFGATFKCQMKRSMTKDPEGGRGAIQYEGGMPLVFERYAGEEIGVKRPWVHRGGLCMGKNWGQCIWMHGCIIRLGNRASCKGMRARICSRHKECGDSEEVSAALGVEIGGAG
ncbi:hypothetical protein B0H13DRAFT_1896012 [Mycena leptocephala]|nr:hypothetical protein B0H13DRAFT_1896012 [Mycena leptocephala]